MSMQTYPVGYQAVLLIDERLAAHIRLKFEQGEGIVSPEIQQLIDSGRFDGLAESGELPDNYCNVSDAYDTIEYARDIDELCRHTEFTGEAETVFHDKTAKGLKMTVDACEIVYLTPKKDPDLFAAAYSNPEQLEAEFREQLKDILPDGTDIWPNICSLNGTYFC